ncbi:MAG: hypothetical protein K9G41_05890 [Flavobacteriales bacterium]|nr:hypothetical protein [Flavobacteriales bacterium]
MRKLLTTIAFIGITQIVFAQDEISNLNQTIKVTLSNSESNNAKLLKNLSYGKLSKGESRSVFFVSVSSQNIESLTKELNSLFPACTVDLIIDPKK